MCSIDGIVDVAEWAGWSCQHNKDDGYMELSTIYGAGKKFSFYAFGKTDHEIAKSICSYSASFDVDKYIDKWIHTKCASAPGVPPMHIFVDDAYRIAAKLGDLSDRIWLLENKVAYIGQPYHTWPHIFRKIKKLLLA